MQTAFLPDGSSIILDNLIGFKASGQLLIFEKADGSQRVYAATAPDSAAYMITQLQTFVATANLTATISEVSLSWASITPNTGTHASYGPVTIIGTSLVVSGVNSLKLDDGAGHILVLSAVNYYSDTTIYVSIGALPQAATYTLYYSTDNGSNWTTTGLTVTAS